LHQCLLLWFCESGISGMLPLCDYNGCNLTRTQKLHFLLYLQFIMNTFNLGFNSNSLAEMNLGKCHWF
jgi:hypothetical protein